MSNQNNVIDRETVEDPQSEIATTTRYELIKQKVAGFLHRNKTTIALTAGSTALVGAGALVYSLTKWDEDEEQSEPYLNFDPHGEDVEIVLFDSEEARDAYVAKHQGDGNDPEDDNESESDDSETTVTETTE